MERLCGRGGIGRRAALRSLWGNPWKFESSRPHHYNIMIEKLYTSEILTLAANINHLGLLVEPKLSRTKISSICGSKITITINLENGKIINYGQVICACVLAQASAAILANCAIGLTLPSLNILSQELESILYTGKHSETYEILNIFKEAHYFPEKYEAILLPFKTLEECFNVQKL